MRQALQLHPGSRCSATQIDAEVLRASSGDLVLRYVVTGEIDALLMPPLSTPSRTDELWRHTCFEAFIRAGQGPRYFEFNFAPSTCWAAYRFDGYRDGMREAAEIAAPRIAGRTTGGGYELEAVLDLGEVTDLPGDATWHLGLSAVIEETGGGLSYWALAHPPGKADFHHSDCFAHQLPAASRP